MPISTIPVKWLNSQSNHHTSRFEVEPMRPFGHAISDNLIRETKDFIELRGSPRPAVRAGSNLVGRGIANPMSERTRGFELPSVDDGAEIPLPALFNLLFSRNPLISPPGFAIPRPTRLGSSSPDALPPVVTALL
jgi:hypothetical protein